MDILPKSAKIKVVLTALICLLVIIILIVIKALIHSWRYDEYKTTGITKEGQLRISYTTEGHNGGGGYSKQFYLTNKKVLKETEDFSFTLDETIFGKVYKPIDAGSVDIYIAYSSHGGESLKYEVYHVTVSEEFAIRYTFETISEETFENGKELSINSDLSSNIDE